MLRFLNQWSKRFLVTIFLVCSFLVVSHTHAADTPAAVNISQLTADNFKNLSRDDQQKAIVILAAQNTSRSDSQKNPQNTTSCFDYYHFGSVQADIESVFEKTIAGVPMHFQGNLKNNNDYPIVEGALYAKVFKKQTDGNFVQQNGHDLVDQFFIQENISLAAKGQAPIDFDWQVPSFASSGEYQIAFFFTSAKKFNLLGLSFTDDVVGNIVNFTVTGGNKESIFFNKNTVNVNGSLYRFASFPPHVNKDADIPVTTEIVNSTDQSQAINVVWRLYGWDAQSEDNLLDTSEESIMVNAGETKTIRYIDTNKTHSVHLLIAEIQYHDTKSLLDIRYGRDNVDSLRLNFPSITSYPLQANQETSVFACMHNAGSSTVQGGKITLDLHDQNGKLIHTYTYDGSVSGSMMAVKDVFTPMETYKNFSLVARLYQDGNQVDEATLTYDCEKIGGQDCPRKTDKSVINIPSIFGGKEILILKSIIGIGILLLFFLVSYFVRKNKKRRHIKMFVFVCVFISGYGLANVQGAHAASSVVGLPLIGVGYGEPYTDQSCDGGSIFFGDASGSYSGWADIYSSVSYGADILNVDTGTFLASGSVVPVGTHLRLVPRPYADTDISWFASGGWNDSPYGSWNWGAGYTGQGQEEIINNCTGGGFSLVAHPPAPQYGFSGGGCGYSSDCTVSQPYASISATITFPETTFTAYNLYVDEMNGFRALNLSGTVPAQSFSFYLSSGPPLNNPPTAPIITEQADNSHFVTQNQNFNFIATDPDNDQIHYLIDWNNDGIGDQWTPAWPGMVNSGVSSSAVHAFAFAGTYIIHARTYDAKNGFSGWSDPYSITITAPVIANFSANPTELPLGQSTVLTWTTSNVDGCWASGSEDWTGWKSTNDIFTQSVTPTVVGITNYALECWKNGVSSGKKFAPVNALCVDVWPSFNASDYCAEEAVLQTSNCGRTKSEVGSGPGLWGPSPDTVCSSASLLQTRCVNEARLVNGTKICKLSDWNEVSPTH